MRMKNLPENMPRITHEPRHRARDHMGTHCRIPPPARRGRLGLAAIAIRWMGCGVLATVLGSVVLSTHGCGSAPDDVALRPREIACPSPPGSAGNSTARASVSARSSRPAPGWPSAP